MLIKMKVAGLTIDPLTNTPIVILKDMDEKKAIPIWIGLFEASAIATELEKITFSRPMTHDLIYEILKAVDIEVIQIEVHDLRNNTFFANVHLLRSGKTIVVNSPAKRRYCPCPAGQCPHICGREGHRKIEECGLRQENN